MVRKAIVFGIDGLVLPLVQDLVQQGRLPHFGRLFREGAVAKVLPFISTWGSINWQCFATGASPGTVWQGRVSVPPFGTQGGQPAYRAETLWQVLARQGRRSALVAYPASWPPGTADTTTIVAPDPGETDLDPVALARPARYMTEGLATRYRRPPGTRAGWIPLAQRASRQDRAAILPVPLAPTGWRNLPQGDFRATKFAIRGARGGELAEFGLLVPITAGGGQPALLCEDEDASRIVAELALGVWSPWVFHRLGPQSRRGFETASTVRFKLLEVDANGAEVAICHSEVYPETGFAVPDSVGRGLLQEIGPYASGSSAQLDPHDPFWRTAIEEAAEEGRWLIEAARFFARSPDLGLFMTVFRPVDTANHGCLAFVEPTSRFYGGPATETVREILAQTYGVADAILGELMELADQETVVAVASDHGAVVNDVMCDIYHLLMEHGLLAIEQRNGVPEVDWSHTQAYIRPSRSGSEVFINLAGREPQGTVSPKDYESLQERIIDLLLNWREPESGRRAVALALKKKDSALVGYWGEAAGDVQFIYNSGFVWGELPAGQSIARASVPSVNHGPQIPTTETGLSSNMGLFALWGAGIRRGYRRPEATLGPVRMSDPAPTLASLLGCPAPGQNEGAVLRDMLT